MPFYRNIDEKSESGRRTLKNLLLLREQLEQEVPKRTFEETLLLASWNIREFDSAAFGQRLDEAYYYIAEIISHFDIVAIQEVSRNIKALDWLCLLLGGYWKYIVTDVTEGRRGNNERMAFLYDSRKIKFGGLSGELVLPPIRLAPKTYQPVTQLSRTPFMCGFKSGWSKFIIASVHILYGSNDPNDPERVEEIRQICQFLKKRTEDPTSWSQNIILLGDFNIFSMEDQTANMLEEADFYIPDGIKTKRSNVARVERHYDQIAFRIQKERFGFTGDSGVFDYYKTVFKKEDEVLYRDAMGDVYKMMKNGKARSAAQKSRYYNSCWRTHQMSDHLPIWVELKIDYSVEYLKSKLASNMD